MKKYFVVVMLFTGSAFAQNPSNVMQALPGMINQMQQIGDQIQRQSNQTQQAQNNTAAAPTQDSSPQQYGPCLVLEEQAQRYQINSCNPAAIQQQITAKVNNAYVMTTQVIAGNQQVIRTVFGERGNELGGNRVEKGVTTYKRAGKLITTVLTPSKSPDCELTEEVVEESSTTLVLKAKGIRGGSCSQLALMMTKDDIASGHKTRYTKISN